MYAHGKVVPQDYQEAAKWYREAAEQGDASVQFELGGMYEKGQGVPQDFVRAHMWYTGFARGLAMPNPGHQAWVNIDYLESAMTVAQIKTAKEMARRCQQFEECD